MNDARSSLISLLQLAYSGEKAAGYAYRGHWKSVSLPEERQRIAVIEEEEWHHRRLVGEILAELGSGPDPRREIRAGLIGKTLGLLCHLSGWFLPMYGAGKLESRNIREYEGAARFAFECGQEERIDCLLTMAEVEWEHEHYFRLKVLSHRLGRVVPVWPEPPPKESIRTSFREFAARADGHNRTDRDAILTS
jgi:hypothetical protein